MAFPLRPGSRRIPRRWLVTGLLLLLLSDLGWRAYVAHEAGNELRVLLSQYRVALQAGNEYRTRTLASQLTSQADRLYGAGHDPFWRLVGAVPFVGDSFSVITDVSTVGRGVVREVLPTLQPAVLSLTAKSMINNGRVDLARLEAVRPAITSASQELHRVTRPLTHLRSHLLIGPVAALRQQAVNDLPAAEQGLVDVLSAVTVAPGMLGADGPRTYFVAVQNNAESRATGGLIGAYAILKADHGRLIRERVGTDVDLVDAKSNVVDLGQEFADHYDQYGARAVWSGAVMTPDFPSAAQTVSALWSHLGHPRVDGVVAIDAVSLADFLGATGPVTINGRVFNQANVADFILKDEYVAYPEARRKQALAGISAALFDHLLSGGGTDAGLVAAVGNAVNTGHLQIWSDRVVEQQVLQSTRVGGALPSGRGAFLEVLTLNAAGNKIDPYVTRKVAYKRLPGGRAKVTVTLRNGINVRGLPPIVFGRLDHRPVPGRLGTTRSILSVYGGVGATVQLASPSCQPDTGQSGTERGHGWASCQVELPPGEAIAVSAEVSDLGGILTYRQQPLTQVDRLAFNVPWRSG